MNNQRGFSLIQMMMAIGISGILAVAIASMTSNMNKDAKALGEKLASIDLTNLLLTSWADPSLCTTQLSGTTFDSTQLGTPSSPELNLPSIAGPGGVPIATVGGQVSPVAPGFKIETIKVKSFSGSGDDYLASMQVNFEASAHTRAHKPIVLRLKIRTDPASAANAKLITACGGANSNLGGSASTYYECTANRNGTCTVNSATGMKICALTKVNNAGCNTCAYLNCQVTGPDASGMFVLFGKRGDDPASQCGMTCI
ncbi:MAG: type II secretion system protein [Bacteriovoracaceae bacterium]